MKTLKLLLISITVISFYSAQSQTTANDYYVKSVEYAGKNDFVNALTFISKAVQLDQKNSDYIAYKGYVQRNTGYFENALISMQKAISLNSNIGWYYVEAVVSAYELKNIELSKEYCKKAISFGKENLGEANFNYVSGILDNLKSYEYTLAFEFNPSNSGLIYENDKTLCIPVPSTDLPYQKSTYVITGATLVKSVKENDFELIFILPTDKNKVSVKCTVVKKPYSYWDLINNANLNTPIPEKIKIYLKSSDRYNLNSEIIVNTAKKLKGANTIETVKNTIKWINEKTKGKAPVWNTVDDIIKANDVECATGSLTVVALLRANGIPARQVWGPVDAGRFYSPENYLKGHVWFEFYLNGAGWIPVEQFDESSIGVLPVSYIRMMTDPAHLFNNTPLANIMTIMHNDEYGDIIKFERTEVK